jgi:predicted nucleic acid-binding protein
LEETCLKVDAESNAGFMETKYGFSMVDALILSTALAIKADVLVIGGEKQYEDEWKRVVELPVVKLSDFEA